MRRTPPERVDGRILREASWMPVPRDPGSSFSFRHIRTRTFPFPFHYHPEVELTYIVKGKGRRIVGEVVRPFQDGDLALIGSMLPHLWLSDSECAATEAYVLRFDGVMVEKMFETQTECSAALAWIRRAGKGLEWTGGPLPEHGMWQTLKSAATPAKRLLAFLDILFTLAEAGRWNEVCGEVRGVVVGGRSEQRIGFALRYLRENFREEVMQGEVARKVGMEASAFSRLFLRTTGQTFQEMLVNLRVDHACRLLTATRMSVADVCFASGFRNLSNFNKQFLAEKGVSPRAYRTAAV